MQNASAKAAGVDDPEALRAYFDAALLRWQATFDEISGGSDTLGEDQRAAYAAAIKSEIYDQWAAAADTAK